MRTRFNKLIDSNTATIFLFLYGLIAQVTAFAIIYFFITYLPIKEAVVEAFVFLWFCIPVIAIFSIITAAIQIKIRVTGEQKYKTPLIGLILNLAWLLCYVVVIYLAFVGKMPFLFTK